MARRRSPKLGPKVLPIAEQYRVHCDGLVESCFRPGAKGGTWQHWRRVRPRRTTNGYWRVNIQRNGRCASMLVHRLVALTWLGAPPFPGAVVRHLDDIKDNNHVNNLAWGTHQDNADDRIRIHRFRRGLPALKAS